MSGTERRPRRRTERGSLEGVTLAGRYHLVRKLGKGGMGKVYEAEDEQLERRVAVKVLADPDANQSTVKRMLREARAAARLKHTHVIQVWDLGKNPDDGMPYIVYELLEGEDLRTLLTRRPRLPVEEVLAIVVPVMAGLMAVHRAEIIHRDLKPENIFLAKTSDGTTVPTLIDFGIARLADTGPESKTSTNVVVGTPNYMAPEQFTDSSKVDHRADVWAMGVVIYEMLAGRVPFLASNYQELLYKIAHAAPTPLLEVAPKVAPALAVFVHEALEKEPSARFPTMQAFLEALLSCEGVADKPWCAELRVRYLSAASVAPPRRSSDERRGVPRGVAWGVLGATVLVAAVASVYVRVVLPASPVVDAGVAADTRALEVPSNGADVSRSRDIIRSTQQPTIDAGTSTAASVVEAPDGGTQRNAARGSRRDRPSGQTGSDRRSPPHTNPIRPEDGTTPPPAVTPPAPAPEELVPMDWPERDP